MADNKIDGPFADERSFPVAQLRTISFAKLVYKDRVEQARLLSAAEDDGFFYLDLLQPESKELWEVYREVLQIIKSWFDQSTKEKTQFAYGSDVQGYRPIDSQTGALEDTRDSFETLRVAQKGLEWADKPLPDFVLQSKKLFEEFISKTRSHVFVLLSSLSDAAGLEGQYRYKRAHDDSKTSNSSMTFHRYLKQDSREPNNVGHNKHTDISSIAFPFAEQRGLQVPSMLVGNCPDQWTWVRPRPGYAICNIGDSLRFLSEKRFRSILHRVMPVAEMEHDHRFSVAYFCRPAHGTMFRDSKGRMIACDEWFSHKFDVYRATHEEQRKNTILTGGMEHGRGSAV